MGPKPTVYRVEGIEMTVTVPELPVGRRTNWGNEQQSWDERAS
jgi:hypothetical protein